MLATRNLLRFISRPISPQCRRISTEEPQATKIVTNLEKSINRITLLGRVGIDPQLRGNEANPTVVFTLATNHNYRFETGEIQQKTEWHRITIFKPYLRDSVAQNVKRGDRVLVDGRLVYGEIIDSKGESRTTSTIIASDVICFRSRQMVNVPEEEEEEERESAVQKTRGPF